MLSISDVGEIMAEGICKYFAKEENVAEIQRLFDLGFEVVYETEQKTGVFSG